MTCRHDTPAAAFNCYCTALMDLVDRDWPDGYSGVVSRAGRKCVHCGAGVPAGIPAQIAGRDRDACPACVDVKLLCGALRAEINRDAIDMTAEERANLFAITAKHPKSIRPREIGEVMRTGRGTKIARGIDATIDRLHNEMQNARTDDERTRLTRVIEAAERARDAGARRA